MRRLNKKELAATALVFGFWAIAMMMIGWHDLEEQQRIHTEYCNDVKSGLYLHDFRGICYDLEQ
jgi:hypothetical protein